MLLSLIVGGLADGTNAAPRARLSDAFGYSEDNRSEGPWAIRRVRIRRSRTDLSFHVRLGGGSQLGLATLSTQATGIPRSKGRPLAAANGDYFVRDGAFAGDPEGLCITEGALVSLPSEKSCFWIAPDGSPRCTNVISLMTVVWPDGTRIPSGLNEAPGDRPVVYTPEFGDATRRMPGRDLVLVPEKGTATLAVGEVRGFRLIEVREGGGTLLSATNLVVHLPESLSARSVPPIGGNIGIDTATLPDLRGVKTAIGGGPALLRGGVPTQLQAGEVRHPRTAIGWNQDDFYIVQVDGRQPSLSVGMSFAELARCFQELGCTEALNLDGGGSSTLWVQGQVANNPSEGGERPMANSLVVVLRNRGDAN